MLNVRDSEGAAKYCCSCNVHGLMVRMLDVGSKQVVVVERYCTSIPYYF